MNIKLKFREWLTVPETAKHLSSIFSEDFTEADVLRLALDNRIKLSVNLVNYAQVRRGKITHKTETELTSQDVADLPNKGAVLQIGRSDEGLFLSLDTCVSTIAGLWDLPMKGSEYFCVEGAYQKLVGGPQVGLININGVLLEGNEHLVIHNSTVSPFLEGF